MDFQSIYQSYFERLYRYSFTLIKSNDEAQDVVQIVFVRLWEKWSELIINTDISAYLYRSVYNESLNRISANKRMRIHQESYVFETAHEETAFENEHQLSDEQISQRINEVLNLMPPQCQTVFLKSRIDNLKYAEIAQELNISIKTVEVHMSKALKIVRRAIGVLLLLSCLILYILSI